LKMGYRLIDTAQVSTYSISAELERFVGRS
jgi:diketogulonate reductase-like aldo/keto reductase